MAEILGAFSYALDITQGQPQGHCIRCCWIASRIGRAIGLSEQQLWDVYYVALLKDLGCSSNAARICQLYMADDHAIKRDYKLVDGKLPNVLRFVLGRTGAGQPLIKRLRSLGAIAAAGPAIERELIEARCTRGAAIASKLRFSDAVAEGIAGLDEHWDGSGHPEGLKGNAIPLYSRLALLAQVIDIFRMANGPKAACAEIRKRTGSWFDPKLIEAFLNSVASDQFWHELDLPELEDRVLALEPGRFAVAVDDEFLDDIAGAFGQVVDAKSPYTSGHSQRVSRYADAIAQRMGLDADHRAKLRRAAFLHDIGKLGVSNRILDKPGPLDAEEWRVMQDHAAHTAAILGRISIFGEMAGIAAAHHERLDGKGYPHGLSAEDIALDTRIITVCDIFDALTSDRPYREAMSTAQALDIMRSDVGQAIDRDCFDALEGAVATADEATSND